MSEISELIDSRTCAVCGKPIEMLYPHLWRYKRGNKMMCSWSCLRKYDRKEAKEEVIKEKETRIRRDRRETLEELIAAYEGECKAPVEFMKECGYKNPEDAWHEMKTWSKGNAPDLYKRLVHHKLVKPKQQDRTKIELVYDPDIENVYREEQAEIARREKQGQIDGIELLKPASLWSRVLQDGTFKKVKGIGMMLQGMNYQIILSAYGWFKLTEEILIAIWQLDVAEDELPEQKTE